MPEFLNDPLCMLQKTLILARHGQTVGNRDGFIVGQSDSPLTDKGIEKTDQLAEFLAGKGIDEIHCSSLGRTRATAQIYSDYIGKTYIAEDAMMELSFGKWEGKSRNRLVTGGNHIRQTWDDRPPGGESYLDAEARVTPMVDKMRRRIEKAVVLLVGHASVNRVFLKLWLDLDPDKALRINFPNDLVYLLGSDMSCYRRSADGITGEGLLYLM